MALRSLVASLALLLLTCTVSYRGAAQARRGQAYWYTVENKVLVLKTGSSSKVLKDEVTLPNGSHLLPLTQYVVLASGEHAPLNQDDMVLPSGDIIRMQAAGATAATASPPATAPARATPTEGAVATAKFTYVPDAPVNGKLKGVVELGASGFNSFIIRVDAQHNWKLEKAEYGNSLVMENMATDDDIRKGLKEYIGKMLDYGVNGHDIHFVVSSGAAVADVTKHIVQSLKDLGYVVHRVTPEQEGALGLRAALPLTYTDKGFLVDMGSANTKIGWLDHGKATVVSSYGSKYYQQTVDEATVTADITAKAAQVPAARRQTCFIIGGIPFELAKAVRQGKEPYTVLRPADYYTQLEGAKSKAGVTLYRTLAAATGCQQFVFGWDTNFTIGYLLERP